MNARRTDPFRPMAVRAAGAAWSGGVSTVGAAGIAEAFGALTAPAGRRVGPSQREGNEGAGRSAARPGARAGRTGPG